MQGSKHHGSEGCIYSFGYVASYQKVDESSRSFSKYVTKVNKEKSISKTEKNRMDETMERLENTIFSHLDEEVNYLSKQLPSIRMALSPYVRKLQNHFDLSDDENLESVIRMFKAGLINGHLCVNARTKDHHMECDASYTMISIPKQYDRNYTKLNPRFRFIFNDETEMILPLLEQTSFIYSGHMLNHHQILDTIDRKIATFTNIATYGNKRLFSNMKASFERQLLS